MKKVAAIILAAGYSRRYGDDNKLLAPLNGKPILSHVVEQIARAPLSRRLVIVNSDGANVASLCDPGAFDVVENADAERGMGSSIAAGVCGLEHFRAKWEPVRVKEMRPNKNLEPVRDSVKIGKALGEMDGVMVVLGDMPFINDDTYARLIEAFHNNIEKSIFAPSFDKRLGHPVIFRRAHFDALKTLHDDVGAKSIIEANKAALSAIEVSDSGIFRDIDRP